MFDLIEGWLLNQVGINCNLTKLEENNIFQDGCLLVNILQKYGLVNNCFKKNIQPSAKKVECTKNLSLLKPLFDMLNIKYNDTIINNIVENKAGPIVNLLYELYICLENKQHLYFITQKNFDKVCQDSQRNLNSVPVTVKKTTVKSQNDFSENMCLEQPLINNSDVIKWYKNKYEKVKNNLNAKVNHLEKPLPNKELINVRTTCKTCLSQYKSTCNTDTFEDLPDLDSFLKGSGDEKLLDYEAFIARYKSKQNFKAEKRCIENAIQHELLNRTWSKIEEKKDKVYNSVLSSILLKQSHYEKQLLSKLVQAQKETHIQNENRIWAKQSLINEHENKIIGDFEMKEMFETLEKNYKNEQKRVLELHKKLYKEKKEIIKKKNYNICKEIVDALLDLAICASEYKCNYGVDVSKSLWNNWMQIFVKSQPIRLQQQFLEALSGEDIDYEEAISFEKEQDEVLNEDDLDEYLMTQGRWFYSGICLDHADFDERNLAHIVYRLLSIKYPLPASPLAADLPQFKVAGALLNFHSTDSIEKLKLLLSKPGIHIFDPEMALKFCMKQFQLETTPPLDEKAKIKTKDLSSKQQGNKDKKGSKKKISKTSEKVKRTSQKSRKSDPILQYSEENKMIPVLDKETQTSIGLVIETEEEKTKRTPLGLLGEEVCSTLKEGRNLNDSLLVSVIIEYLKTLEEYNGWLLLNYPTTIDQAYHLELALTGGKIPMELFVLEENNNIQTDNFDEWKDKRKSRLLNYPKNETGNQLFKSYLTVFIKIQEHNQKTAVIENNKLEEDDQVSHSNESKDLKDESHTIRDFLKEFYCDQLIFKEFFSSSFDFNSLKLLARVILKEDGIEAKPSIDIFGEETLNKLLKGKKPDKKVKLPLTNKNPKLKAKSKNENQNSDIINSSSNLNKETDNIEDIIDQESTPVKTASTENLDEVKEQNYQKKSFVCLPLNNEFGALLATIWENIESCYINNLKEILFENRFVNLRLHPYCIYVEKEVKKVADKKDSKQDLIIFFQEYYNSISNDLRTLPEMKNQLYCRVLELQQNLWGIADQRKNEIEAKRREIISENWLVSEICLLINNYLSFVQTELERSIETLQLINDYYLNMLERSPLPLTIQPEYRNVGRLSVEMLLNTVDKTSTDTEQIENYNEESKINNFIAHSLVFCPDKEKPFNTFEKILFDKISDVKSNFNVISNMFNNQNKTGAGQVGNSKKGVKAKSTINTEKMSIKTKKDSQKIYQKKNSIKSNHSQQEAENFSVTESLIDEWQSTINTEVERFNFRLDLIHQRAKENIFEFYCFIETEFCNVHSFMLSSYNTDISNVNILCNYLRTAIEEESLLQHPLALEQDNFYVNIKDSQNIPIDYALKELKEDVHDCIFTIDQLNHLINIFKIAGPLGVIRKQPLCFILQDLMLLETCDNHPYLPRLWGFLSESQLRYVIDDIFGLEFGVDWRDFIIYNLDIPYPEVKDILQLREKYIAYDIEETETIALEDYEKITLWFENELPSSPKQGLRFALIKKLLPEMFKVDRDHINYTALILYFCKDFNPVLGFKKALSLSLGKNVVISKSELEIILQNEEEINNVVACVLQEIIDGIVITRETAQVYECLESPSQRDQSNNGSQSCTSSPFDFDSWQSVSVPSLDQTSLFSRTSHPLVRSNTSKVDFNNISSNERQWVTKIPVTSALSVLNSSFFYQDRRFALKNQYLNCLEEEADSDGMVEAYDLVDLPCIQKLFSMTNKFKISIPCDILRECLNDNSDNEDDLGSKYHSTTFQSW